MFKFIAVFLVFVVVCQGDETISTTASVPRVFCGYAPNNLFTCFRSPKMIERTALSKCKSEADECSVMKCIFRESNWLTNDGAIDKDKVKEFYIQFAAENPSWSAAVEQLKTTCLVDTLPMQGIHLNCPAYDVMHCIQLSFFRNAPASQWVSSYECEDTRIYAKYCPLCPDECFAAMVPRGSCNACRELPRSP